MHKIFLLLVVFQIKHYLADYPFQTSYMMGKFKRDFSHVLPLACHAGVHASITLVIVCFGFHPSLAWLAIVDFCSHYAMDRVKASPDLLGRYKALSAKEYMEVVNSPNSLIPGTDEYKAIKGNRYFWLSLGFDQLWHHMTHYYIIYKMVC